MMSENSFGKGFMIGVVHASMGNHQLAADIFRTLCNRFPEHRMLNNLAVCLARIDESSKISPRYLLVPVNKPCTSMLGTTVYTISDSFDDGQLILTLKPLRPNLTHLDKCNSL